jgi:hypothetical protein
VAKIDNGVLSVVLEQHRQDILRSLRARGHRLSPNQVLVFDPVEHGVGMTIRVLTKEEQAAEVLGLQAKDFFSEVRFCHRLGWNPIIKGVSERLHRIVNGHVITVAELLESEHFTATYLAAERRWESSHIDCLREFLKAHGLSLKL